MVSGSGNTSRTDRTVFHLGAERGEHVRQLVQGERKIARQQERVGGVEPKVKFRGHCALLLLFLPAIKPLGMDHVNLPRGGHLAVRLAGSPKRTLNEVPLERSEAARSATPSWMKRRLKLPDRSNPNGEGPC